MIQRKQTLFLFLAIVAIAVCLFLPVATIVPPGMGVESHLFNLGIRDADGSLSFGAWPLCLLLTLSAIMDIASIFLYHLRKLQAKLCIWSIILCVLWYGYYVLIFTHVMLSDVQGSYHVHFAVCLPLVAAILTMMARRGVLADESLIRAADRIR